MAQFVVLEPQGTDGAERARFMRDGFSLFALILPIVWLLLHRLWFEALAIFAISILLSLAGSVLGFAAVVPVLFGLIALLVALEGQNWQIAKLRRQGFVEMAAIEAEDEQEAELRYFYPRSRLQPLDRPASVQSANSSTPQPAPFWSGGLPASKSNLGATIGFVGHRGE